MLKDWGYNAIDFNVDLIVVAHVIQIGSLRSLMRNNLVKNILRLLSLNWDVSMAHAYQQSNR
jgi:hypothetical protein